MKTILLASQNQNKAREIKALLGESFDLITMKDYGIDSDIIEDALSYEGNALIKVRALKPFVKGKDLILMADDSGLSVNALDGAPGIYSARFAGEQVSYTDNNKKLLEVMKNKEDRSAAFICAIAIIFPDGREVTLRAEVLGEIAFDFLGEEGFGYDPLFIHQETKKTYAEMSKEEKNALSHRAVAVKKAKEILLENQ